ncbi:MAG: di-heme oxidoredictase family protein [Nannocystaceae bacterium]
MRARWLKPTRRLAATAGAALLLLASGGDGPVPWPGGDAPDETALAEQVQDALALADRERFEEYLEAWERGEDAEHIFVQQEWIDDGFWSLPQLFVFGDALFGHEFRADDGYGDQGQPVPMQRVHQGRRGGLDSFSCAGCHSVGGANGAGAATQNAHLLGDGQHMDSTVVRNSPAVIGLGLVQALAFEMSGQLQATRDEALVAATERGQEVRVQLSAKGIDFGFITARADGTLDGGEVEGVDADLVVKPFGWKGSFSRLRRVVEDAARIHFGIQSHVLALRHQDMPDPEALGAGPQWYDPDDDGKARELEEGILTAAAVYLAMLEAPQIIPPHDAGLRDRWAHGSALFDEVGCDDCHRRELPLLDVTWEEWPDTTAGEPVVINLLLDGEQPKGGSRVQLFSDLRRHDMGPQLADPHELGDDDLPAATFLTRPLWGLAETPPYLHDGRAATIPAAILAHGGEAEGSRDAFTALSPADQADLHVFLLSLSRAPRLRVPQ